MTSSRVFNAAKVRRRQLNIEIAEAACQLVELVRERINDDDFDLVNRIVVGGTFVSAEFVDDSIWDITEWRRR